MHYQFVRTKKHWWSRPSYELIPVLNSTWMTANHFSATWTHPAAGSLLRNGAV